MHQLREEKIRRPAPFKTRSGSTTARPSTNGWKVVRMEVPPGGGLISGTVSGYSDKSERACRIKADEMNSKVKLGENAPLVSYVATKN